MTVPIKVDRLPSSVKRFGVPAGFLLILFLCYPFLFTHFSTGIPFAKSSDQLYIMSIIQFLTHAPLSSAYHLPYFYPTAYVTTYGHPLFGIAFIFKLFQLLGLSLTQSANLYIIAALLAGTVGCFLLVREVCGDFRWAAAVSIFYLVCSRNYLYFVWFNFLSNFWIPWVFYFLLRYFRLDRWRYLFGASFCVFYQFFTEIYYGLHLFILLLPFFLVAALWQKILSWRRLVTVLVALFLVGVLIAVVYFPFLGSAELQGFQRKFSPDMLFQPRDLFPASPKLLHTFRAGEKDRSGIFPGAMLAFLLTVYFIGEGKRKTGLLAAALILALGLSAPAIRNGTVLEVLSIMILLVLALLTLRNWKLYSAVERSLLAGFGAFFVILLGFKHLTFLNALLPYRILYKHIPGMAGLRGIRRILPMFFPFWMTLAALSGLRLERIKFAGRQIPRGVLPLCVFAIIILENYRFDQRGISGPLLRPQAVYAALPQNGSAVVLDWPCFFRRQHKEMTRRQMFSWGFHHNSLINGKTAFLPDFVETFKVKVGSVTKSFPTEDKLRRLIENNSVDYVVFHFDERMRKNEIESQQKILQRVASIKEFGEIVYSAPQHVVMRLRERSPVTRAIRTYSLNHLRHQRIRVFFETPCPGAIRVLLNGRNVPGEKWNGQNEVVLDFRREKLKVPGNRVEIRFPASARLARINLFR